MQDMAKKKVKNSEDLKEASVEVKKILLIRKLMRLEDMVANNNKEKSLEKSSEKNSERSLVDSKEDSVKKILPKEDPSQEDLM